MSRLEVAVQIPDHQGTCDKESGRARDARLGVPLCCFLVVVICASCGAVSLIVAKAAGEEFVRRHDQWTTNITRCESGHGEWTSPPVLSRLFLGQKPVFNCLRNHGNMLTPANYSQVVNFACASDKLKQDLSSFNKDADWKYVEFPSRAGDQGQATVTISAWWLPARDPKAPRIIVQHGNNVNFNDRTVTVAAFLLRSMGFACIVPNLRDHGVSGRSDHETVGWGFDYHLDILGAWDYAAYDPEGKLGGAVGKDRVGILGFSMGGFAAANAFGLEPDVPAAWIDSGVYEPRQVLDFSMAAVGLRFLSGLAWLFASDASSANLTLRTPATTLPTHAEKKRPIAIVHGQLDDVVPPSQSEQLHDLVRSLPDLYDVKELYRPSYVCKDSRHVTSHIWNPGVYRQKLCNFWTSAFGLHRSYCGIDKLPHYYSEDSPVTRIAWSPSVTSI